MSAQITRVEVFHFRHPLAAPVTTVMGPMVARPALLIRVEDADGAAGWGEIWEQKDGALCQRTRQSFETDFNI